MRKFNVILICENRTTIKQWHSPDDIEEVSIISENENYPIEIWAEDYAELIKILNRLYLRASMNWAEVVGYIIEGD